MKGGRLCGCFFLFSNPRCMGKDQKHRDATPQILKPSEVPDSYMAEIPLCVGGSESDLVGITQKARGWPGNVDKELASCVSSENRLGGHAPNSGLAAKGEDSEQESLERVLHLSLGSSVGLTRSSFSTWQYLTAWITLLHSEEAVHWKILKLKIELHFQELCGKGKGKDVHSKHF